MKIVLVGYMGSGKSTVASVLSEKLGLENQDLDDVLEAELGMSIAEIFAQKGEIQFRLLEHKALKDFLKNHENFVLSTGGGTPCYSGNMNLIVDEAVSVYLRANVPTLSSRLKSERAKRPLIAHLTEEQLPEFIAKHTFERRAFYEQAEITVDVSGKDIAEVCEEVLRKVLA